MEKYSMFNGNKIRNLCIAKSTDRKVKSKKLGKYCTLHNKARVNILINV